ncbi:MAG: hypothetical protein PUK48_03485, partial [Spirochaetales bacterium]|nr:hypothetical protein [Spirochaetales bacterium]
LDHRAHFVDVYDESTADKMNRNMIYTAITRSIEMLHIFTLEDSTANAINDLKEILKNDYDETPLSIVRDKGNRYIVGLLHKSGAIDGDDN